MFPLQFAKRQGGGAMGCVGSLEGGGGGGDFGFGFGFASPLFCCRAFALLFLNQT